MTRLESGNLSWGSGGGALPRRPRSDGRTPPPPTRNNTSWIIFRVVEAGSRGFVSPA